MQQFTEKEAEDFLEKNNFPVVERAFANKKENLKKIKIPFPWVMKISSKNVMHKAKIGGVKINIKTIEEAEKHFNLISKIENFEEVIIQKQISGKEIILGIKKTPEFGHVIMFGKGGTNIEKEKDVSFRVIPIKDNEIISMIKDTNFSKNLLEREIKNCVEAIKKLQEIIQKNTQITELDINPLIINELYYLVADARYIVK
jgi:hypothetical protein